MASYERTASSGGREARHTAWLVDTGLWCSPTRPQVIGYVDGVEFGAQIEVGADLA